MPLHAPAILNKPTVPVRSGSAFRVDSPPANALVTPQLAAELHRVLERFAVEAGAGERQPVRIFFKPGIFVHHQVGRAADVYAVNGLGTRQVEASLGQSDAARRRRCHAARAPVDRGRGNRLAALQSAPAIAWAVGAADDYPVQLFGPWTRTEGPWKPISDFLLHAHRDHIHLAK